MSRKRKEEEIKGAKVRLYYNGKTLDNAHLSFERFDLAVLEEVMEKDPWNCYPYVIDIADDLADNARNQIKSAGLQELCVVNPTPDDWGNIASLSKGKSKALGQRRSKDLDAMVLKAIQQVAGSIAADLKVIRPEEKDGSNKNEDARVLYQDTILFRGEGKSIKNKVNVTERFPMVAGRPHFSHGGTNDLFWHGQCNEVSWIEEMEKSCAYHIAEAYVEFSSSDTRKIVQFKKDGNEGMATSLILKKQILLPNGTVGDRCRFQPGTSFEDHVKLVLSQKLQPLLIPDFI